MGLSPLERYTFDVAGYLLFDGVLPGPALATLRAAVAERALPSPGEGVMEQRFAYHGEGDLLAWDQCFRDLVDHPLVLDVLDTFVGPHVRLDHSYGIMMRTGTAGLGLHGPATPFDPAQYYVHRGGRIRSGLLSCAWALSDGAPGDGGFGCIPGSHRAEEPVPPDASDLVVEVPQRAGSLLVFTEALVHCTVPWTGREDRVVLLYKYSPGNSSWTAGRAAAPAVLPFLSERQRRLVEAPYVGGRAPAIGGDR